MTEYEEELKRRRLGIIVIAVMLAVFLVNMVVGGEGPRLGLTGLGLVLTATTVLSVGAFTLGTWLSVSRPGPALGLYFLAAAAALALHLLAPHRPSDIMLFVIVGTAASQLSLWASGTLMAATGLGFIAQIVISRGDVNQLWSLVGMVSVYVAVVAGRNRRRTRRIEQENLVLAERGRIAREIHDILAHSLSAQLVHLEGAKLLAGAGRVDEAVDRIERARELARGGLTETRRALDTLRGETLKVDEAVRELAAEHREAGGGGCEITLSGPIRQLSAEAGLAVVRTVQEALTNVRKHAAGAEVSIALRCRDGECEVEVADAGGRTGTLAASGSGYGLVGMRERAELIGGSLEAGPRDDGFAVVLRVPS